MDRKIIHTGDGSHSIEVRELGVTYHSVHGAIRESKHVFIEAGLIASDCLQRPDALQPDPLRIFEVGFGTGLNGLLTVIESQKLNSKIYYHTVEAFPLDIDEARALNYCKLLKRDDLQEIFEQLHRCEWEAEVNILPAFTLAKTKNDLLTFQPPNNTFDLVYFDAFAPNVQPELWTEEVFRKMFSMLKPGGILVTYSSKGSVRRAMLAAGFKVEKIPGPKGKREIVRAVKGW